MAGAGAQVTLNAEENRLTGVCVRLRGGFAVILVEGVRKARARSNTPSNTPHPRSSSPLRGGAAPQRG